MRASILKALLGAGALLAAVAMTGPVEGGPIPGGGGGHFGGGGGGHFGGDGGGRFGGGGGGRFGGDGHRPHGGHGGGYGGGWYDGWGYPDLGWGYDPGYYPDDSACWVYRDAWDRHGKYIGRRLVNVCQ